MDEPNGIATAHLRVARPTGDLDAVVRFYRDGLGFAVPGEFKDHDGFEGVMLGHAGAAYRPSQKVPGMFPLCWPSWKRPETRTCSVRVPPEAVLTSRVSHRRRTFVPRVASISLTFRGSA